MTGWSELSVTLQRISTGESRMAAQTLTGGKNGLTGISGSSAKAKFSLILGTPEKERYYQITKMSPGECCQDTEEGWNTCDISGEKNRVRSALRKENFRKNLLLVTSTQWAGVEKTNPDSSQKNKVGGQEATDKLQHGKLGLDRGKRILQLGWLNTGTHVPEGSQKLRTWPDESWINLLWLDLLWVRGWTRWPPEVLSNHMVLLFCDFTIYLLFTGIQSIAVASYAEIKRKLIFIWIMFVLTKAAQKEQHYKEFIFTCQKIKKISPKWHSKIT